MSWGSFAAFLDMGGYGLYVGGSYGVTVLVLAAEVIAVRRRKRAALAAARQLRAAEGRR
jgi:heme exporter protein D